MLKISSSFFIPRENDKSANQNKRVRLLPLYSFPHFKDLNYKIREHHNRYFLHLDLDAFFAQVEQRDNPSLRGKPVAVGGSNDGKGIVMTASYEARRLGVDTVMSVLDALKICPQLICLPCCGPKYEAALSQILDIIANYVPEECIEKYSVDECFVDLTGAAKNFDGAIEVVKQIKREVKEIVGLTTSAGLSYNKTYAKLATKFEKPDGLSIIRKEEKDKIYEISVQKLWGIGSRIEKRMRMLKIKTIGDLAKTDLGILKKEFGVNGIVFHRMARGQDTSEILTKHRAEKSFSHQHTLTNPIYKPEDMQSELRRMVEYICRKMRAKKLAGRHIVLSIRYQNLSYRHAEAELSHQTNDDREVFKAANKIMPKLPCPTKAMKARAFAIHITDLRVDTGERNLNLYEKTFDMPYQVLDNLKERYGEQIIRVGIET